MARLRWLVLALVCLIVLAGCGDAGTSNPAAGPAVAAAERDLLTLLPDQAAFPRHLTREDGIAHGVYTLDKIVTQPAWNLFGVLVPGVPYRPAMCTASHNPDAASYVGRSFALVVHFFEDKSTVVRSDQSSMVGATVAKGELDQAAVRALAEECATVTIDAVTTRFVILPNPKADPDQVFAIRMTTGSDPVVKLTYVAQVNGYTVTAYAVCGSPAICEKELKPVFLGGTAKARAA